MNKIMDIKVSIALGNKIKALVKETSFRYSDIFNAYGALRKVDDTATDAEILAIIKQTAVSIDASIGETKKKGN